MSRSEHFRVGAMTHQHMLAAANNKALGQLHMELGNRPQGVKHLLETGRIFHDAPRTNEGSFKGSVRGNQIDARFN